MVEQSALGLSAAVLASFHPKNWQLYRVAWIAAGFAIIGNATACMEQCAAQRAVSIHIPKTAGGTVAAVLRGCGNAIRVINDVHTVTVPQVFAGQYGPGNAIIVIRDPADRLISLHNMEKEKNQNCPLVPNAVTDKNRLCKDTFMRVPDRVWDVADFSVLMQHWSHARLPSLAYYLGSFYYATGEDVGQDSPPTVALNDSRLDVLCFDELSAGLSRVQRRYCPEATAHAPSAPLPEIHVSRSRTSSEYNMTDALRTMLRRRLRQEYDIFSHFCPSRDTQPK